MVKKNRRINDVVFKRIILACFIFMLAFSFVNITRVLAGVDKINVTNAIISDKSSSTEASITSFSNDKIVTDVKYHNVNEYVEFTVTLKNNDSTKYTIKTITDNNTDSYIVYDYDKHENESLLPNNEKDIVIKATYKTEVTNINERKANDNVEFKITFIEEDGSESEKTIIVNPTTGDNLWIYMILGVLSLSGLLTTLKFKKTNKALLILLLMTPFFVKAANLTYDFNFVSEIGYYDKILVTVDRNGTKEQIIIPYGTKITEPAVLNIPGYNFAGYFIDGNPADFSKDITEDTVIEAKYNVITYNITYDLAGGTPTGSNPSTYTVEDEFTLSNPKLTGYNFAGWTGTNLPGLTPTVTINKGTTGNLNFTANFSAATDTKYKVNHKYQKVIGDGYDVEEEKGTGVTGTTIYPQVRPRTGFTTPSVQSLEILPDGSASIDYVYDRIPCTYEADSNTNSSLGNGTYRYGTNITVSPKNIPGYTFTTWEDGSANNPRTITLTENISVSPSYSANTDTPYTVTHRYQKVTLDGYDEEYVVGTGTTDTVITAPMQTRTGFTTPSSTTVEIKGDGSGSATYTYDRLMFIFNVTDRTYLTPESDANSSYPYGKQITVEAIERAGYDFTWLDGETSYTRTFEMDKDVQITPVYTARTDTPYTVTHRYQKITLDGYDEEYVVGTGTTDTVITAPMQTRTGFTTPSSTTVEIKGDGSGSATYTYDRVMYNFSVTDRTYLTPESDANGSYPYGKQITVEAIERAGYDFTWSDGNTNYERTIIIDSNIQITPEYTADANIPYDVNHHVQRLDGSYEIRETEHLTGTAGQNVTPTAKSYTGFTLVSTDTKPISGAGDTVFDYYYTRDQHTLTIINPEDVVTDVSGDYYYQEQITITAKTKAGYTFTGWSTGETTNPVTITMDTSDISIKPEYTANTNIPYDVNHHVQRLDGSYEIRETEHLTGTTGQNVTPTAKSYTGFTLVSTDTKPISGAGDTVFDYYYTRDQHTLTIINPEDVVTDVSGDYYYEEQITITAKTKAGYTFTGWSTGETTNPVTITMGTSDISIKPEYTPNTNTPYDVNHHVQRLDGSYEIRETEHLTGTTGQNVTPTAKSYTGFTLVSTDTKPISGAGDTVFDYYYTRDQHTLTIINPEDVVTDVSGDYYYEEQITITAKTKAGYTFDGWSTGETTNPVTITMGTSDISIKPEYTIITYTITFDENGGSDVTDMVVAWNTSFGDAGGLPTTSLANHTFAGWFTDNTFTTEVTNSTVPTSDMSLVAKLIPDNAVAELNNNEFYTTIQDAIDNASSLEQSTIKILKDVTQSTTIGDMYSTNNDKDIIFDLNGHTLYIDSTSNARYVFRSRANIVVKNGIIRTRAASAPIESNAGTLVIDNVQIYSTGTRQALYVKYDKGSSTLASPVVEIRGNSYLESKAQASRGTAHIVSGTLNIKSATIISTSDHALYIEGGTVNIGTSDGAYDNTNPVLKGETYGAGVKSGSSAMYSVYDGILMGKSAAVSDENKILNTEPGSVKTTDNDGTYYILYYQMP